MEMFEYFFVFSFLGWVAEVVYQATSKGLIVNRGFLSGPMCPIYGAGMCAVKILIDYAPEASSAELFLCGAIFASIIELTGGFILHKLFNARWWDYSDKPLNFHGYICLEFSIIWGLAALLSVKVICPIIDRTVLSENVETAVLTLCTLVFVLDLSVSIGIAVGLNRRLREIDTLQGKLRLISDPLSRSIGENALETTQKIEESKIQVFLAKDEIEEELETKRKELRKHLEKTKFFGTGRLVRAFPSLKEKK